MEGWSRDMMFHRTGLFFTLPSPNMPSLSSALAYPGLCLLEGTNMSEGRGTTRPFNIVGAPFLNYTFADALRASEGSSCGVVYRETYFIPTFSKWQGNVSSGVDISITDFDCFDPLRAGLAVLHAARAHAPGSFGFLGTNYIDLLTGSNLTRLAISRGDTPEKILAAYDDDLRSSGYVAASQAVHLY